MCVYLCLGANLDQPLLMIEKAVERIKLNPKIDVLRYSSVLPSKAYGIEDQPDFYNQVLELETAIEPSELLNYLKSLEQDLGRVPSYRWGPRLIDIDILFYGSKVIQLHDLQIPHPDLHNRHFVLVLLNTLIPDFIHPVLGVSIANLYNKLTNSGGNK